MQCTWKWYKTDGYVPKNPQFDTPSRNMQFSFHFNKSLEERFYFPIQYKGSIKILQNKSARTRPNDIQKHRPAYCATV